MSLTSNLKRIGWAAHEERRDQADMIDFQNHQAAQRKKVQFNDVLQAVRDTFADQDSYNEWWAAAPEDGFFEYAENYLLKEMEKDRLPLPRAFIVLNEHRIRVIVDATKATLHGTLARVYPEHMPEIPWIVRAEDIEVEA